jgi:hypothetical protein
LRSTNRIRVGVAMRLAFFSASLLFFFIMRGFADEPQSHAEFLREMREFPNHPGLVNQFLRKLSGLEESIPAPRVCIRICSAVFYSRLEKSPGRRLVREEHCALRSVFTSLVKRKFLNHFTNLTESELCGPIEIIPVSQPSTNAA